MTLWRCRVRLVVRRRGFEISGENVFCSFLGRYDKTARKNDSSGETSQPTAHWVSVTTLAVIKTRRHVSPSAARHVFHDAMSERTAVEISRGGSHARGHREDKTSLVRSLGLEN